MEASRHWRMKKQRYALDGIAESSPHGLNTPSNGSGGPTAVAVQLERPKTVLGAAVRGTVYSHTTVFNAPFGFEEQAPYVLALVQLESGGLITAQLTDLEGEPSIGMPVEMVTRKLRTDGEAGIIIYGYKFRPLLERAH